MAQRPAAKLRMVDRVGELGFRVFAMVGRGAMEPAGLPGNAHPSVCSRHTGAVGYATAHQVDRAARLVAGEEQDVTYRTTYRWIDAWEGAHAGWCACELREYFDGTKEVHRSEPQYLHEMPDDSRMHAIYMQAQAHLMARTK